MTASSSPVHFWACLPMGLIAFTQTISQWPADETQNTKSSICKPHLTLHWECPCFLAAVRQHHDNHDQRHHCSQHKACAGSDVQAGQQVGKTPPAFDPFCMCLLRFDGCTCCRFALWLHSAGSDLLSLDFQYALGICSQDPDSFLCQGLLCDAADESFVPSSDFQTPLNLKFQNCLSDQLTTLTSCHPPHPQRSIWLGKETIVFFLIMKDVPYRIRLLRLCKIAFSNNEVTVLWSEPQKPFV